MAQAGSTSHTAALTPESEVAEHLRLIGDFVQVKKMMAQIIFQCNVVFTSVPAV